MERFKTRRVEERQGAGNRDHDFPEIDPKVKEGILNFFHGDNQERFNTHLGMKLVDIREGYSRMELETTRKVCQPADIMHGGASFGLADAAVALALVALFGPGKLLLTIEMKINYLEPIPLGSTATAEAYVLRASRSSAYAEVDIWAAGKLAARCTTTYMIRDRAK